MLDPAGARRPAGLLDEPRLAPRRGVRRHARRLAGVARVPAAATGATSTATPPGRRVLDTTVRVAGEPDELVETRIDLGPALTRRTRPARACWCDPAPRRTRACATEARAAPGCRRRASASTPSPTARRSWRGRATSPTARRWRGVELALGGAAATHQGADGARADRARPTHRLPLLVARRGADVAILPAADLVVERGRRAGASVRAATRCASTSSTTASCTARARRCASRAGCGASAQGPRGDVEPLPASLRSLAWTLRDSQGNESAKGRAALDAGGGFDLALKLPPTLNLGTASVCGSRPAAPAPRRPHAPAQLLGPGVPAARVRGQGRGERGAVPHRRRRDGHGDRRRTTRAARCRAPR